MKKQKWKSVQGLLKILILLLFISTGHGQQLKQIGTFTAENYPVYHLGYNLQSTADGNFLMIRGGNFQNHELVKTTPGVPNISNWNGLHTNAGGLSLPAAAELPEINGWEVCFCYDVIWNVTGYGLCKDGLDYGAYKDDPNLRLFKTAKAAEKQVIFKPVTNPVGPIPIEPTIPDPQLNAGYYNPDFPNYETIPGTQILSPWWKGWVGYSYGANYWRLVEELPGGESHFEFYGQNVAYPAPRNTNDGVKSKNGLVQVDLPTHSTTTDWHAVLEHHTRSKIRMELYDMDDRLVWRLYDTKGGFHPLDTGWQPRGNNHSDGLRFLKPAKYKLKYWNLNDSGDPGVQTQRFEFLVNNKWIIKEMVNPESYREWIIDMSDANSHYKLNCNLVKGAI
ncbi:hypothetical protein [Jiulongibacter sp. NS-SX5]|uniref:hypothetical protein n=1 Tax=Jiulongibacter sp. NS-SX5 TaxID=3463854 RepID=UPI00405A0791